MFAIPWTKLIIAAFVGYISYSVYTVYSVFVPSACTQPKICIHPFSDDSLKLGLQISVSTQKKLDTRKKSDLTSVWNYSNFSINEVVEKTFNVSIPTATRNNGSLYVHALLYHRGQNPKDSYVSHYVSPITTLALPQTVYVNLLGGSEEDVEAVKKKSSDPEGSNTDKKPHTHWRPLLTVNVLHDSAALHRYQIPQEIYYHLTIAQDGKHYFPVVFIDEMGFRLSDLMPVNESSTVLPLTVKYTPISLWKMRLWIGFSQSMKTLKQFGFTEKDVDEVKGILVDTNAYLLILTFVVSLFHLLFDFLAFKSEVMYWRSRETMVGLSTRVVVWRCLSTGIIFLYLMDEKTSLLVLIPAGIGMLIELWKVTKAMKITVIFTGFKPTVQFGESSEKEKETQAFDSEAMKYLAYVLYPLCIGGALYSLIYVQHKSWYSWSIHSLVHGVYAFGFLFMLPQLFVNYKLKSVAHLPWRAFMYKAVNTFIDDIFAFIITMPTSHRLACFRDDIVFLIYLYQRWLYPVDKKRQNEFGESFDDGKSHETKKTK
ncbi:unnamed protein product [Lymnaea stagnalis]|uniref:Lipid scramblase CLPTM1L n=1 Tax=Lymnaea stagnalis TaxID=6523 RepID=A0AAV2HQX8_LYMST